MSEARKVYLTSMGLSAANKKQARQAALERAHEIRQFEIDLYWKRANYFWLFQAAVFAAIGLSWRAQGTPFPAILPVGLAALGTVTAWAGLLAAHSSKFWQRNWEHQIDMLEAEFEGNLYKTVYVSRAGTKWSLSGLSEGLSSCYIIFWILTLLILSFAVNPSWTFNICELSWPNSLEQQTLGCWLLTIAGAKYLYSLDTSLQGERREYSDDLIEGLEKSGSPQLRRDPKAKPYLVRRIPKI